MKWQGKQKKNKTKKAEKKQSKYKGSFFLSPDHICVTTTCLSILKLLYAIQIKLVTDELFFSKTYKPAIHTQLHTISTQHIIRHIVKCLFKAVTLITACYNYFIMTPQIMPVPQWYSTVPKEDLLFCRFFHYTNENHKA